MDPKITAFFAQYEKANAEFDVPKIANLYADSFMFANANGVQPVRKEDFLKVLPRRKEFFRSAGLVASKVSRVEDSRLDSSYVLAKVTWIMRVERGGKANEIDNFATYILRQASGSLEIVFQIDHQDLMKRLEALG